MNIKSRTQKVAISGILIAIAVIFGTFSIPIGAAKISPVQHFVNVVAAVVLGPMYAVANAFVASLIRNILGTGSVLAFPGSMVGAFLAGILYKHTKILISALIGEVFGTGIIGAMLSYPIAVLLLGKEGALFMFIAPFTFSCFAGAALAYIFLKIPVMNKFLNNYERESEKHV